MAKYINLNLNLNLQVDSGDMVLDKKILVNIFFGGDNVNSPHKDSF